MGTIVIKIGTNTLTDETGKINQSYMTEVASQVDSILMEGKKVLLVSSGAIGAGTVEMGLKKSRDIPTRQAMAAVGQGIVMKSWYIAFSNYDVKVGQILITYDDFSNRERFLNLKNTLEKLMELGVVPIMNENDPISVNEIGKSFGDNDKMSSLLAAKLGAEKLLILSDIDGLYNKDPKKNKDAVFIPVVEEITFDVEKMCGKTGSAFSSGGMESKINAAKIATAAGVPVVICNGTEKESVIRAYKGEIGTLFKPHKTLTQKKSWIKEAKSSGAIHIDAGACKAVKEGKNLLPAGIVKIEGSFDCESIVELKCDGKKFAKAISDYSSDSLLKMVGKKSSEIGTAGANIIKRENLVLI